MYSALHIAADKGHLDVVQLLIATKSKIINWENKYKRTALISAASTGKSDVVKFLLESGAAITKDYEFFNCLDWSLVRNYKETAMTIMCHSRWKEVIIQCFLSQPPVYPRAQPSRSACRGEGANPDRRKVLREMQGEPNLASRLYIGY